MVKKIFLFLILSIELFILVVYNYYQHFESINYFNYIYQIGDKYINNLVKPLAELLNINSIPYSSIFTLILINVVFIILYLLICKVVSVISYHRKMKKIRKVVKIPYSLSEEEKERFDIKNYQNHFPWVRILLMLVPITIFSILILARFDSVFSTNHNCNYPGKITIYNQYLSDIIKNLKLDNTIDLIFNNSKGIGYFDLINKIPTNYYWIEYVALILVVILTCLLWWLSLTLIYLPFKKFSAKRRAKKAKNHYVYKKELKEYKYRVKHGKEYSQKSEQFMEMVEEDLYGKQTIAKDYKPLKIKKSVSVPDSYYDDLGYGVKDAGIGDKEEINKDKAFIEREVRYISDNDYDIVLENEPIIEVVEDNEIDKLNQQEKEDELFYEKYQPEKIDIKSFENYDQGKSIVNDYLTNIKEEDSDSLNQTQLEEDKNEDNIEEEIQEEQELTGLEKYRLDKQRLLEERNKMIEEGTLTEENDPLKKYRKVGVRNGKVEAKVPTMKEIEEEKQRLKEERSRRIKEGINRRKAMLNNNKK